MSATEIPDESAMVFFIMICLLIGGILKSLHSYLQMPYTPLLLFGGVIISVFLSETAISQIQSIPEYRPAWVTNDFDTNPPL